MQGTDPGLPLNAGGDPSAGVLLSVVVPAYNSEGTIGALVERLQEVDLPAAASREIILVNDGSRDRTWEVIQREVGRSPNVFGIDLFRNFGQHNAILCGIRAARGDWIITIDDDLQQPPESIPALWERAQAGYDVVYGAPQNWSQSAWRSVASIFTKVALQSAMGAENARHVASMRLFRASLREAFTGDLGSFVSIDVLLSWASTRFTYVLVPYSERTVGRSNYTFRMLVRHAFNMITGFSVAPLQFASLLGFATVLIGLVTLLYVVARALVSSSVPGFPFLASIISIYSGVQLFTLGIFGEYLARVHVRSMRRPTYAVRESTARPSTPG